MLCRTDPCTGPAKRHIDILQSTVLGRCSKSTREQLVITGGEGAGDHVSDRP